MRFVKHPATPLPPLTLTAVMRSLTALPYSGMFWRTAPEMSKTSSDSNWPRNGHVARGRYPAEHPGWAVFENGFWLPTHQKGFQILWDVK